MVFLKTTIVTLIVYVWVTCGNSYYIEEAEVSEKPLNVKKNGTLSTDLDSGKSGLKNGRFNSGPRITGSSGKACSVCLNEGTSYYWCYLDDKKLQWDYCSPKEGLDYRGRSCLGPCGYQGYGFKWCYTEGGSWGYCSVQTIKDRPVRPFLHMLVWTY